MIMPSQRFALVRRLVLLQSIWRERTRELLAFLDQAIRRPRSSRQLLRSDRVLRKSGYTHQPRQSPALRTRNV